MRRVVQIETLTQTYMHLTNVSLNKDSPAFVNNVDANVTNVGSKWTLKSLLAYVIEHEGIERATKVGWVEVGEWSGTPGTDPLWLALVCALLAPGDH